MDCPHCCQGIPVGGVHVAVNDAGPCRLDTDPVDAGCADGRPETLHATFMRVGHVRAIGSGLQHPGKRGICHVEVRIGGAQGLERLAMLLGNLILRIPHDRIPRRGVTGIEPGTDGPHFRKCVAVFGAEFGFRLGKPCVLVADRQRGPAEGMQGCIVRVTWQGDGAGTNGRGRRCCGGKGGRTNRDHAGGIP
ncbi:MAG: hypothetical protein EBT09_02365 [Actinobacteria bacterium]|nr:hypothetical protein [Actinomycetota bacterium]